MGLFDVLTGRRKVKQPAAGDALFGMVTAEITLETELDLSPKGVAAIVFQPLDTGDFRQIVKDAEELLASAAAESGTRVSQQEDSHGYSWVVLRDRDFEDLVTALNLVSEELRGGGYGDRLLCAVFPFQDSKARALYWIYNYKRGAFYPFAPTGEGEGHRDTEREFRVSAAIKSELRIEPELERWFPLWGIPV